MKSLTKSLTFFIVLISFFGAAQSIYNVKFTNEKTATGFNIIANNDEFSTVSVEFNLKLTNLKSSIPNNVPVVIPGKAQKFIVATLTRIQPNKSTGFYYQSRLNIGDATLQKADDLLYALPYPKGKKYLVFQGYDGNFSHQGTKALDFNFKNGEPVHATRAGLVVNTKDDSNTHCSSKDCAKFNNFVRILHSDGTFGEYAHLKQSGVTVKPGDKVEKGQLIGYSGDTGWATGPHLHFSVYFNRLNGERTFISTKFKTKNHPEGELLEQGKIYENVQ